MKKGKLCVSCGHSDMQHDTRDLTFTYKARNTVVAAVPGWFCPHCGEAYLDDMGRYSDALDALVAQVKAEEQAFIRTTRKRLHLTQAEAARIFGGGVNAFSEYERGKTQPHKSTMLLLNLLNKHPELLPEVAQNGA